MATNFQGKVIGMSLKDRGAILPAGHFANWAFGTVKQVLYFLVLFYGQNFQTGTKIQ
jgi:hypothetical protein